MVTPRRVVASGLSTVIVMCAVPRRIKKTTSPTAALAIARAWISSVTGVPLMARTLSPFITRPEAAQPSATSVTITFM